MLLMLVGMALHGGATLAENELEVRDFDVDDEEEARAAGHFDSTQQEQEREKEQERLGWHEPSEMSNPSKKALTKSAAFCSA